MALIVSRLAAVPTLPQRLRVQDLRTRLAVAAHAAGERAYPWAWHALSWASFADGFPHSYTPEVVANARAAIVAASDALTDADAVTTVAALWAEAPWGIN